MKLAELKQRAYEQWEKHCRFNRAVIQTNLFKDEIRSQFGDLRRRSTWENALCRYRALNAEIGLLDAFTLITQVFNFRPGRWDYPYRHQIFEEFLTLPNGLELLRTGLEQIFSNDVMPTERNQANGFFELVQAAARGKCRGVTARPAQQLLSYQAEG